MMYMEEKPQHMRALEKANDYRFKQAALYRQIKAKQEKVSAVLEDLPVFMDNVPIGRLLRAQVRWGRERTRAFLVEHGVGEMRPCGRLLLRQRYALAAALKEKGC